jgi:vacuolar iron transporter family protein
MGAGAPPGADAGDRHPARRERHGCHWTPPIRQSATIRAMAPIDTAQSLENLKLERDAIVLYDALARIEKDERRAGAFRMIAANERRHAEIWAGKLRELGVDVPAPSGPRLRVRFIIVLARVFGTHAVSELVQALEGDEEELYDAQESPEVAAIAADEREHAEIWRRLAAEPAAEPGGPGLAGGFALAVPPTSAGEDAAALQGVSSSLAAPPTVPPGPAGDGQTRAQAPPIGRSGHPSDSMETPDDIARRERWHRSGRSGTLRAVIFGVSDGLVSNLSLVMGVAGAAAGQPSFILLAGVAGLLAGASSMAAGEYISMQSQRELFQRQIALERAELEAMPEEEEAELAALYRAKGFTREEARAIAHRLFQDPDKALDTLVREELGLDPDELGSPWGAATGSFLAFAVGAAIPVIPYVFLEGTLAFTLSLGGSLVAAFGVGAGVSLLTGRSTLFSGLRQVAIGALAAGVTYMVGSLIGVAVA